MLHRNTLLAICVIFCAIAVGAGLFVATLSGQSGLVAQQPGLSTSQPATTAQPTPAAETATTASEPTPDVAPIAALVPTEAPATDQPAPTVAPATDQPAPTSAPDVAPAPSDAPAFIEHTVQKGDLLNDIAKKYNVTVKDILALNDIPNADSLTVGQILRIPRA